MTNVLEFKPQPKKMSRQYKQHKYTVTYVPGKKLWHWDVEIVHTTRFGGDADTQVKAYKAAEKHIDGVLKMQGKEVG